jgi:hypothetical protein
MTESEYAAFRAQPHIEAYVSAVRERERLMQDPWKPSLMFEDCLKRLLLDGYVPSIFGPHS